MNHSAMISARFLSNSSFIFSSYANAIASLHYHSFPFPANGHQIRRFSFKPRLNFGCIRKPDDAIALFHQMVRTQQHLPPSVMEFTKLLSAVMKMNQYSVALHLFDQMLLRNAPVNHYTFSIVIDCYCRLKRPDFGLSVLGSFFKRGYQPDAVTFNTLIKGLSAVEKIDDAAELLNKLMDDRLCQPNEFTYLAIINGYCKAGKPLAALHLLAVFEERSCKPNVYVYTAVIDGLCKLQEERMVDDALQLFSSLADKGISPNAPTYSSMIKGLCSSSRWNETEELVKKMVADEVYPDVVTLSILMDAFCKEGRVEAAAHRIAEAFSVLHSMEDDDEGIIPNIVTYNTLISGLFNDDKVDTANDIFNELPSKGLQPNVVTYNILIGALCNQGQMEEAKDLLMQMVNNGCLPNRVTYNVFVQGLLERNKIEEAMVLLEEMNSKGFKLDETTSSRMTEPQEKEDAAALEIKN